MLMKRSNVIVFEISKFRKQIALKILKTFDSGSFGVILILFDHDTAVDFQKVYSILRLFAVECFHSSNRKIKKFPAKLVSRKSFGFSTPLST